MLSDESITRIDVFYSVAKLNDSALTLSDLSLLLGPEATPAELEQAFESYPVLNSKYQLKSGFVFEKGSDMQVSAELAKKTLALRNTALASALVRRLRQRSCTVIAVSGSTSYNSVKLSDDLDLFCVTRDDSAWIFLTKALLLLRASRLASARFSSATISCVMDSRFAEEDFGREQDALFARDALNAMAIHGAGEYTQLLRRAGWIAKFFPRLYTERVGPPRVELPRRRQSVLTRIFNQFLFLTVGRYVKVRSLLENRRFARSGAWGRSFVAMLGPDHCIFESLRYKQMRKMYGRMDVPAERQSGRVHQAAAVS